MLFFMLSGFLMSYLYMGKSFNKNNLLAYTVARVGRVVPLYFVVVLCSYCLTMVSSDVLYEITDYYALLGHLLFLSGESVLWSIPPEIQFYFIFVIFWTLAKNRVGYVYLAILAVMILLFLSNFPRISGEFNGIPYNFFNTLRSLPFFFIGVIFGLHYKSLIIPAYLKKHVFVLALCLIPLMYPELSPVTSDAKRKMWLSYEVLLVISAVFFCLVFLVPDNNILLVNQFGDFIGKISYSLYLLHMPIIVQVNKLDTSIEFKLLLSFILSLLVAYLSLKYFEQPAAKLIRRISTNK